MTTEREARLHAKNTVKGDVSGALVQATTIQNVYFGALSKGGRRSALTLSVILLAQLALYGEPQSTEDESVNISPATGVSNARCLRVKDETQNVSVFKDAIGDDKWTEWPGKTRFWSIGETTHPNRWRVPLDNRQYGYVGKDSHYIITANDCR